MIHVPCSHVGHIARSQPYHFPQGRLETEHHNYRRAIEVWMDEYKEYVYEAVPAMKVMCYSKNYMILEIGTGKTCKLGNSCSSFIGNIGKQY